TADVLTAAAAELVARGGAVREVALTDEPWLYLKPLFQAEAGTAERLRALLEGPHPLAGGDSDVAAVEHKLGITLASRQREAIAQALSRKVLVITGGPGTGKSTLVRGILDLFEMRSMRCGLAAPTGRAARRLAEATGREAKTIHRLLEFDVGGPKRNLDRP